MIDLKLLKLVGQSIDSIFNLSCSKWGKTEPEVLACQVIKECHVRQGCHGEAFSWLGTRDVGGSGLRILLADGSLVQESYEGPTEPPEGTVVIDGKPQILRVTSDLLRYAAKHMGLAVD